MHYNSVHPKFKLNGACFSREKLCELAYCLIKEGEPYEIAIGDFLLDWLHTAATLIVTTSGTTGIPKSLVLQKKHMYHSAVATGSFLDLRSGDRALLCLPADYIAGKMMLVRALVLGLELDYTAPTSTPFNHLEKSYDFAAMVPLQLQNSLPHLGQLKKLLVGGAPVSGPLLHQIKGATTSVYETYGMTETISHIALKNISAGERFFNLLPNISISLDPRGCLVVMAPMLNDAEIITNDMVALISRHEFQWLGRFDTVINSGGIKLNPEVIEEKLKDLVSGRFFIAGIPDALLGQKLILVVEGPPNEQLMHQMKHLKTLQKYEIPKAIYALDTFSTTPNGKIQRGETLKKIEFNP